MHISHLDQITPAYQHVVLSPHLDDAALSCGGLIAAALARGERALVVTLCTAAPPPEGPFNAVAVEFHADWGLEAAAVMDTRLAEERLSMQRLAVDYYWADLLDAIYRVPDAYYSRDTLFAEPTADDPLHAQLRELLAELRRRAPAARFYAPLGVGSHVDHLVTLAAARAAALPALSLYEDVPYVLQPGALEMRLEHAGQGLEPRLEPFDAAALAVKIDSIDAYVSQVGELFGGSAPMAEAITRYTSGLAGGVGYAERMWAPVVR